jgi:hypothetical protein
MQFLHRVKPFLLTMSLTVGCWLAASAGCIAVASESASALEAVSSTELQAAFVYNLMLFSQWPDADKRERVLCTAGQNRDSLALPQLDGRELSTGTVRVKKITLDTELAQCDALFIASLDYMHLPDLVQAKPVLVFSNLKPDYANNVAIVITSQGSRVVFDVNLASLRKSGVHLGASVLRLARSTE